MRLLTRDVLFSAAAVLLLSTQSWAVILYSSNVRNTAPPGSLTNTSSNWTPGGDDDPRRLLNSGWQWQGLYQNFIGIPIANQYFITAKHAGAQASTISVNGVNYTIDKNFNVPNVTWWMDDANSDLRIFKIQETFSSFAPLYAEAPGSEVGRRLVVFGRGTQRGAEVRVNNELKGWQWGPLDGVLSWGENTVTGNISGGPGLGQLMYFNFDRNGVPNEAALSNRDSTGGVFIQSGGVWKLAGINLAVTGPWYFDNGGAPGAAFDASIFDAGGLWVGGTPQFITNSSTDIPGASYSTLISTNLSWINSVIGASAAQAPEPAAALGVLVIAPLLFRRRGR